MIYIKLDKEWYVNYGTSLYYKLICEPRSMQNYHTYNQLIFRFFFAEEMIADMLKPEFRNYMKEISSSKYTVDLSKKPKTDTPIASYRKLDVSWIRKKYKATIYSIHITKNRTKNDLMLMEYYVTSEDSDDHV